MTESHLTLDAAVDLTRTGDLWLFRGRAAADQAIRVVTNAPVNHVGMAVVLDDLPPLMWHAELGKGLRDVWSGTHHRGVQAARPARGGRPVDRPLPAAGVAPPARRGDHPGDRGRPS